MDPTRYKVEKRPEDRAWLMETRKAEADAIDAVFDEAETMPDGPERQALVADVMVRVRKWIAESTDGSIK